MAGKAKNMRRGALAWGLGEGWVGPQWSEGHGPPSLANLGGKFSEKSSSHFKKTYFTQIGRYYLQTAIKNV